MKTVAVIQARLGSTRLPGKVMMKLGGHPVLEWCVRACRHAVGIDEVWVATTVEPRDKMIADWCDRMGILCFCGSEKDVLDRFMGVARAGSADVLLRLTGDCPFLDPRVISEVIALQKRTGAAYCSNIHPRTYPDGLDVECFTRAALEAAHAEATRPIDRDCVTTWIVRNRSRFPAEAVINPIGGMEKERWVLDTAKDFEFCEAVAKAITWSSGPLSMFNMLRVLDRQPELRKINADHIMNERFYEALAEEEVYSRDYSRSQAQLEKARKVIPLGAQTFSKSHLQFPQPSPLFVTHGEGGLVWDIDGNEYVDLVSALLPSILGYGDADVDCAIRKQLCNGISFSLATELEAQLAETLCRLIPCAEMVRFGKTGTDATTAAVRLARAYTGRSRIFSSGYHGWASWSVGPDPIRSLGTTHGERSCVDTVNRHHGLVEQRLELKEYAAVIVEPDDAEGLPELRRICDRTGTLLIFDEVITGFRYDLGGAQKLYGVTPDLACFGKAMANGMPLSAVVGKRDIMRKMEPPDNIFYSGTFFGETLSLAAAIATIEKLEREQIIFKLWARGTVLGTRITNLIKKHELEDQVSLYGAAPMLKLKFQTDKLAALFRKEMIASGTLIIASNNLCAAHGQNELLRICKSYDYAFGKLAAAMSEGDIDERLAGGTIAPMVRAS